MQFTAARFVQQAATHAGLHHMQFGFAHGAFEPEQKPVVKMGRIIESIFVEDQGAA